ncbi:MAG TPA: hypothetical protein VFE13_00830 [Caulobacteraceae bacterium]|nr:hypothetical protein [Caulobacteraceae bacterium]
MAPNDRRQPYTMHELMRLHLPLMQELATRIELAQAALNGGMAGLAGPFAYEYCYLQLRRSCEILALSTLAQLNSLPGARTADLRKEYSAHFTNARR